MDRSEFAFILGCLISALVAFYLGWLVAHGTVSDECQRLGGFYVGKNTFDCKIKEPK